MKPANKSAPVPGESGSAAAASASAPPQRQESWRETIESIVIAFILAFLFRTFEAEAFVIPTGSMAPTLYGQHRDITCSQCGTRFAVGASTGDAHDAEIRDGRVSPGDRLHYAVCPNSACQFTNDVLGREIFAGDRILVNKFPYEFRDPVRWDVVVFKFPERAKTNYIKRLVGLPGEVVRIRKGDIWVRKLNTDDPWRIARKPIDKQVQLQLLVHDNDHPARPLLEAGWPEAWGSAGDSTWQADAEQRSYRVDPAGSSADRWQWLRYTHYVPQAADWNSVAGDDALKGPTPQLIRDTYAYNMRITAGQAELAVRKKELPTLGYREIPSNWVSDLTLTCEIHPESAQGEILLELVEGARRYRCRFDLATGQAQLFHPSEMGRDEDDVVLLGSAFESGLTSGRSHTVRFANVDDRLVVWVDDSVRQQVELETDSAARYQALAPDDLVDTPEDRSPLGIAVRGAAVRVAHLQIHRDIYYTDESGHGRGDPEFPLLDSPDDAQDEFLMLGDNSPRSNDSRLWRESHAVPRRLLIGKAFCIYWPHAMPFLNDGKGFPVMNYYERGENAATPIPRLSLPFYPQFGRMKRIW